jgi:hypothetical protein
VLTYLAAAEKRKERYKTAKAVRARWAARQNKAKQNITKQNKTKQPKQSERNELPGKRQNKPKQSERDDLPGEEARKSLRESQPSVHEMIIEQMAGRLSQVIKLGWSKIKSAEASSYCDGSLQWSEVKWGEVRWRWGEVKVDGSKKDHDVPRHRRRMPCIKHEQGKEWRRCQSKREDWGIEIGSGV